MRLEYHDYVDKISNKFGNIHRYYKIQVWILQKLYKYLNRQLFIVLISYSI